MDRSKKNLSAVRGDAPIKKQGHTKDSKGFFGTDPNMRGMVNKDTATDLGTGG